MPGDKQIFQGLLLLPHAVRNNTGTPGGGRRRFFLHVVKTGNVKMCISSKSLISFIFNIHLFGVFGC